MIKTFVICLNPFISHFLPTIALAKHLQSQNYKVKYLGFSNLEEIVRNEGFEFIALSVCGEQEISNLQKKRAYRKLIKLYQQLHEEIRTAFNDCEADIVMMGISRFAIYLLPALSYKAKVILYSLCAGSPWMSLSSPPVTFDYIYTNYGYQKFMNFFLWFRRFIRKVISPHSMLIKFFYPWPDMFRFCRHHKIKWKFGIDGFFPSFPVITIGSKHMEFCGIKGMKFTGLCVTQTRNYGGHESHLNLNTSKDKPLIYCSLGTMSGRYRKREAFYSAIIELFKANPQWNLIISLGNNGESFQDMKLTENIQVVHFVPQLNVLKHANLMITHGGHGTVKECVNSVVPLIVLPCSYDQRGNAARVHHHQIGIMSPLLKTSIIEKTFGANTRKITPQNIKILIQEILENPQYQLNIQHMRDKIEQDDELIKLCQSLIEI